MLHGLRPIVDDDEAAIAALSPEERADLEAWARMWDDDANAWERLAPETRRLIAICLPTAAVSVAVLKAVGG